MYKQWYLYYCPSQVLPPSTDRGLFKCCIDSMVQLVSYQCSTSRVLAKGTTSSAPLFDLMFSATRPPRVSPTPSELTSIPCLEQLCLVLYSKAYIYEQNSTLATLSSNSTPTLIICEPYKAKDGLDPLKGTHACGLKVCLKVKSSVYIAVWGQ